MEKSEILKQKVEVLCKEARKRKLPVDIIRHVFADNRNGGEKNLKENGHRTKISGNSYRVCRWNTLHYIFLYIVALVSALLLTTVLRDERNPFCAVNHSDYTREMLRPVVNCDFCRDIQSGPIEENIESERFLNVYAYTAVPVLIKGGAKNWTAVSKWNYRMIKYLFFKTGGTTKSVGCEFLRDTREYETLEEFFRDETDGMGEGKSRLWYVGWHICWPEMRQELSKYYQRPSFLPEGYTTNPSDYIFMGVAGRGSELHLDTVDRPTLQAQIIGKKTWSLIPPTECQSVCHTLNVTVDKGDIFVLDTSIWFHSTLVHPGEMSIAINTEFD